MEEKILETTKKTQKKSTNKSFLIFIVLVSIFLYYISQRYLSYLQLTIILLFAAGESFLLFLLQRDKLYLLYLHIASLLTSFWIISFANPELFYPLTSLDYYNFDFYLLIYPAMIFISLFFVELFPARFSKGIILMVAVYSFVLLLVSMLIPDINIYSQSFVYIINFAVLIYFCITIAGVYLRNRSDILDFLWSVIFFSSLISLFYADRIFDLNIDIDVQSAVFTFLIVLAFIMIKIRTIEQSKVNQEAAELRIENANLKKSSEAKKDFIRERMEKFRFLGNSILSSYEELLQSSDDKKRAYEKDPALVLRHKNAFSYFADNTAEYFIREDSKYELNIKKHELREILEEAVKLSQIFNYEYQLIIENNIEADKFLIKTDEIYFKQLVFNLIDIISSSSNKLSLIINADIDEKINLSIDMEADKLIFMSSEDKSFEGSSVGLKNIFEFKYYKLNQLLDALDMEMKFEKIKSNKINIELTFDVSIYNDFYKNKEAEELTEVELKFDNRDESSAELSYNQSKIVIYTKAEDNNLKLLEDFNILSGFSFIRVKDEQELLKLADSNTVLVVFDIYSLSDEEIKICSSIRERFKFFDLPILIMASHNLPKNLLKSYEIGINDFVKKPFEVNELRSRIRTLITLKAKVEESLQREQDYLRAQIKPHFLYNTLDTIAYLCDTNAGSAGELIIDLANYLRYSFDFDSSDQFVPIEKELELVGFYTSIQKERFKDKFEIDYQIDGELNFKIPPFMIQALVENSLKQGLKKIKNNGLIEVFIKEGKNDYQIEVRDNGVGIEREEIEKVFSEYSGSEERHKIGLKNINQRLKRQFNESIDIVRRKTNGTAVKFNIPK